MRLSTKISLAAVSFLFLFSRFFLVAFGRYADRYGGSYQTAGVGHSGKRDGGIWYTIGKTESSDCAGSSFFGESVLCQ